MRNFLPIHHLEDFLDILERHGEVHLPLVSDQGVCHFARRGSSGTQMLEHTRSVIPPKKYLIAPRDTLLTYTAERGYAPTPPRQRLILVGVNPCDLHALSRLDQALLGGIPDSVYAFRRKNMLVIGSTCLPDDLCFCRRTGHSSPTNFDLFLECEGEGYVVSVGSDQGKALVAELGPVLAEKGVRRIRSRTADAPLPPRAEEGLGTLCREWEKSCFSCGACAACCPTCYCFDIRETGDFARRRASRTRTWDCCLFREHGEIAGGSNFRNRRSERLLFRCHHKLHGFGHMAGTSSCVGCGRCRAYCPAGIDFSRALEE